MKFVSLAIENTIVLRFVDALEITASTDDQPMSIKDKTGAKHVIQVL